MPIRKVCDEKGLREENPTSERLEQLLDSLVTKWAPERRV